MTTTCEKGFKTGYKIVSVYADGSLASMSAPRQQVADTFYYYPQRFVVRREGWGPLAVFDNLYTATHFYEGWPYRCQLWECEYTEARKQRYLGGCPLWRPSASPGHTVSTYSYPEGTAFAHSVRLTQLLAFRDKKIHY